MAGDLAGETVTSLEAKRILETLDLWMLDGIELGEPIGTHIYLDGEYTADELEAIACWLRDPKAVVEAK